MQRQDAQNTAETTSYLSKSVMVNGQPVTLYSTNGITWLSSTEELHEVMDRLDNTKIRLHDPKGEATPLAPKPTAARYRLRGPKSRPILEQEGRRVTASAIPETPIARPQYRLDIDLDGTDDDQDLSIEKGAARGRQGRKVTATERTTKSEAVHEEGRIALAAGAQAAARKVREQPVSTDTPKTSAKTPSKVKASPRKASKPASPARVTAKATTKGKPEKAGTQRSNKVRAKVSPRAVPARSPKKKGPSPKAASRKSSPKPRRGALQRPAARR